jgi:hypothetical protein
VRGEAAACGGHHAHGVRGVDLGDVDDVRALQDRDVHGLVAGLRDGPGDLLALGGEVQLLGVPAAELIRAHAEAVASGLARYLHDVRAGGERGHQLVHGGAGQLELAHDVGGGECSVPVEKELENVESPGHCWHETSHDRPPP